MYYITSGSGLIKIHYYDYLKRFKNTLNEVDDFSIKYRYCAIVKKRTIIVSASILWRQRHVIKVDPRCKSDSTDFHGIGRGSSDCTKSYRWRHGITLIISVIIIAIMPIISEDQVAPLSVPKWHFVHFYFSIKVVVPHMHLVQISQNTMCQW